MDQVVIDTIYLLSCSINQVDVDFERVSTMDMDKVLSFSSKHMVSALVGNALHRAKIESPKFSVALAKAQRKMIIIEHAAKEISERLETECVWHMFLKGFVIKQLYPGVGTREMADLDILVDPDRATDVMRIMESLGYETQSVNENNVDSYTKAPLLHIEIHKALFGHQHDRKLYDYYSDIRKKLVRDKDCKYLYVFTPEDNYIYMIAHEYKHYKCGGTGIRSLLDTYVFLKNNALDWEYVDSETRKIGISAFEKDNKTLARSLFGGSEVSCEKAIEYYADSGALGTVEHLVANRTREWGGRRSTYLFRRLFGIYDGNYAEYLKQRHPMFYKHKVLLPVLPFYRLGYMINKHPKRLAKEVKLILKREKKKSD